MIRTIILLCLLFGAKVAAEPYLYVNTLPTFGFGIKSNNAHFYLGLNWSGYFDKYAVFDNKGAFSHFDTSDNLIISPTLGFRYDFNRNVVMPYIDGSATASYNFAQNGKTIPLSFLMGFGIAVKIVANVEISGEYSLNYQYEGYSSNGIARYKSHNFTQAPSLSFVYYIQRRTK